MFCLFQLFLYKIERNFIKISFFEKYKNLEPMCGDTAQKHLIT